MSQLYRALCETALGFAHEYGPPVALAIVLFVAGGLALRVVSRLLPRGGTKGN
jgi:hypothetical protein